VEIGKGEGGLSKKV